MPQRLGFWLAVGCTAVLAQAGFNLIADGPVGQKIPAIQKLNNYATRSAG
jgi:hypothetical protein